jgi:hypothetical protein
MAVLGGGDKYLCAGALPGWNYEALPIVGGKIGGLYAGEELVEMAVNYGPRLEAAICCPLRVAVHADDGRSMIFLFQPKRRPADQGTKEIPMGTDTKTEEMIKDLGADKAPRITEAGLEAIIVKTSFLTEPLQNGGLLTICVLHTKNGFSVTGEAAAVSAENYRPEIGERVARQSAFNKLWPLEGYLLAQRKYEARMELTLGAAPTDPVE